MTWTAPTTNVAGTTITASWGNTDVRDNTLDLHSRPYNRCVAYHSTTQSISGGPTALNLDSESIDTATMHDLVTNNNRVTIPSGGGGGYLVVAQTYRDTSDGILSIRVNGTAVRSLYSPSGQATDVLVAYIALSAGDIVDMTATATAVYGNATAALANRLTVVGPLPPS